MQLATDARSLHLSPLLTCFALVTSTAAAATAAAPGLSSPSAPSERAPPSPCSHQRARAAFLLLLLLRLRLWLWLLEPLRLWGVCLLLLLMGGGHVRRRRRERRRGRPWGHSHPEGRAVQALSTRGGCVTSHRLAYLMLLLLLLLLCLQRLRSARRMGRLGGLQLARVGYVLLLLLLLLLLELGLQQQLVRDLALQGPGRGGQSIRKGSGHGGGPERHTGHERGLRPWRGAQSAIDGT